MSGSDGATVRTSAGIAASFRVLPLPREIRVLPGHGLSYGALTGVRLGRGVRRPVLGPILSSLPETRRRGPGVLTLERWDTSDGPRVREGYRAELHGDEVLIRGCDAAGLFYGCATLEQLLEDARDTGETVPACRIEDRPDVAYRAVHIDVKHHLDTMKSYYDTVDRLAAHKINAIVFEFEDKLRYRRRPEIGGPLSIGIEEMAALTRYARDRHVEISPLVQGLGHATFILKHPQHEDLREVPTSRWAFCPLNERTYDVQFDLYRDAMEATPDSRYLHVGGDEVDKLGSCPRCRAFAEAEGRLALFLHWLNRVCAFALEHGRIPVFWDDMILNEAGVYETTCRDVPEAECEAAWQQAEPVLDALAARFPAGGVYMRWNYTRARQAGNVRALDWYRRKQLAVMIATAAQSGPAVLVPEGRQVECIRSFTRLAAADGVEGVLCTAWDDNSTHSGTHWRGYLAASEFAWFAEGRTVDDFESAYLQRAFGPDCVDAGTLHDDLSAGARTWNSILLARGTRNNVEAALDLPNRADPGAWGRTHADRIAAAQDAVERARAAREAIDILRVRARRNRDQIDLLDAINSFQETAPALVLALAESDRVDPDAQAAGTQRVLKCLDAFQRCWDHLQRVYGKTRFAAYPSSFIPDRYFHFASRREDLSWLIEVEQELHPRIRHWAGAKG